MKNLIIPLIFLAISAVSFGQVTEPVLTHDLVFDRAALKNIRFVSEAQRLGKSVRVYVGFTLTEQGNYTDVSIVNSGSIEEPYKQEINRFWSGLPKQDPKYAGRYVLPIAFMLGEGGPKQLKKIANESDTIAVSGPYKVLDEVSVIGYLVCELKALIP